MAFLEIACFDSDSALVASSAGADRIELCEDAEVGGTTPSVTSLSGIRDRITIPIFVMIRPRGGDFVYSEDEFQQMKASITQLKPIADGFVFGILDRDSKVDMRRTSELVALAHPLQCTFHRAFDQTVDLFQALDDIVNCGLQSILTSGGKSTAIQGCDMLARLVDKAQGTIVIMPGGGVRSANVEELRRRTKAISYHSSALIGNEQVSSVVEILRLKEILRQTTQQI
jgi:copper homeostasis protein